MHKRFRRAPQRALQQLPALRARAQLSHLQHQPQPNEQPIRQQEPQPDLVSRQKPIQLHAAQIKIRLLIDAQERRHHLRLHSPPKRNLRIQLRADQH